MKIKYYLAKLIQKIRIPIVRDSIIDKKAKLCEGVIFYNSKIQKYSYVGSNTCVVNTTIGSFCSISSDCEIGLGSHPINFVSTSPVFYNGKNCFKKNFSYHNFDEYMETMIGNDVWIGSAVKIKSGVKIGDGAIIGAGAVVTKDVPPYAVACGIPASIIKYRFSKEIIDGLKDLAWWNLDEDSLTKIAQHFDNVQSLLDEQEKTI